MKKGGDGILIYDYLWNQSQYAGTIKYESNL